MNVRDIAERCEARKVAYRQSKDGFVVSFVIHPDDLPEGLTLAPIGTRYVLAFCAIDDDEQPIGGEVTRQASGPPSALASSDGNLRSPSDIQGSGPPATRNGPSPAPATGPEPGRARKRFDELSPTQQAGILSSDPSFWKFLVEERDEPEGCDENTAASWVRWRCGVDSRANIKPGTEAAEIWAEQVRDFRAWVHAPEYAPEPA